MSLFSVLNVGTRGMNASQLQMDVTSQNISNADVEGYSRKRVNTTTAYHYDSAFGQMGMGAEVIDIERMRNTFIDDQIRRQNMEIGYFEEMSNAYTRVEDVFSEPSDEGLQHYMDQFFDSWQNLANNPSDVAARTMVRSNAEVLVNAFHSVSGELKNLRQEKNEELPMKVERINQISQEIFNLNQEIGTIEIGSQNANDSRDKRDMLLKELSEMIDITTRENDSGQVTVTTSGSILVSPVFTQKLEMTTSTRDLPDGTNVKDIGIQFSDSKLAFNPKGGQLKGLLDSRDIVIPQTQEKLDELALALTEKVNELHTTGYSLNGYSGISFFDPSATGASDVNLSASIMSDIQNIAAASAGQKEVAVQNTSAAGSHDFGGDPIQLYRDPGMSPPVEARNIVQSTVNIRTPGTVLKEGVDYHVDYANGTFQMLHSGYDTEDLTIDFQYRSGGSQGPGDNSNALEIAKLRNSLTMNSDDMGNPTSTFSEYYGSFVGKLGLNTNQANSSLETRNYLIDQYEAQQDSISGVSLDEEMANLIRYQHTYSAAARLITTTDQMLQVLMNM
ncbi:MAG: flagellar hook-associated protein FlgK [Chitinispirillaceae bacterium]